jgi:hypothetical protein
MEKAPDVAGVIDEKDARYARVLFDQAVELNFGSDPARSRSARTTRAIDQRRRAARVARRSGGIPDDP